MSSERTEQKLSVTRFPLTVKLPNDFKEAWVAKVWTRHGRELVYLLSQKEGVGGGRFQSSVIYAAYIVQALLDEKERFRNASIIVFGSNTPSIESMILQLDASSFVTTVCGSCC